VRPVRFEQFDPQELRILVDGLRAKRNHVYPNWWRPGYDSEGLKQVNVLLSEAESVLAEHDEEHRREVQELMGS
jgi:hypothetical protein